ncbi:hypothetical protein ABEH00_10025 [Pantoea agglomerans]|uniref:hypothetical protein n=1 Tax=Enterobacter agglomerans TaxID=549 RepID=UPI001654057F|nr:hypothetical protein [Pantoea agglomerans]MBD8157219.1 hypothetical protein [Pantoea agglomerans]MBD8234492.1 hypothetical protein [Pantoea agglomerans]
MEKLSNAQMIEKLASFRATGDQLAEDVFDISEKFFSIVEALQAKVDKTDVENEVYDKLNELTGVIFSSVLDAEKYNNSMWKDYTKVIKNLGGAAKND